MLYKLVWLLAYITPSIIADTASVFTTSMKQAIISERIVYKSDSIHVSLLPGDCNGAKKTCDGRHRNEVRTKCKNSFSAKLCLPNFTEDLPSTKFFHLVQLKSPRYSHPIFSIGYYKKNLVAYIFSDYQHINIGSSSSFSGNCIDIILDRRGSTLDYSITYKSGTVQLPVNSDNAYFKFGLYTNYKIQESIKASFSSVSCD